MRLMAKRPGRISPRITEYPDCEVMNKINCAASLENNSWRMRRDMEEKSGKLAAVVDMVKLFKPWEPEEEVEEYLGQSKHSIAHQPRLCF